MIHHITIASENLRRVGEAMAEILPGKAVHSVPSDRINLYGNSMHIFSDQLIQFQVHL